ncbi:MAG: DUF6756 family protein [Bacteroidota bacterium]
MNVNEEVLKAIKQLALTPEAIQQCISAEAAAIITQAKANFVKGNPRVWWLSLSQPFKTYDVVDFDSFDYFDKFLHQDSEFIWFIPEPDNELEEMVVFKSTSCALKEVLGECPFFEYYILTPDFKTLLIENDHNEIIVCNV